MPRERIVAGIMSGTSVDGIDVAILRLTPDGEIALLGSSETPFNAGLRDLILAIASDAPCSASDLARLHTNLALVYSDALTSAVARAGILIEQLDLIGCHGQTVAHLPGGGLAATLQAGSGAALAALSGVPVVHDFRAADLALGGQGAPLIPFVDWLLFGRLARERPLGVLNIGGIANVTLMPAGIASAAELIAFDTGPGNMAIDGVVNAFKRERFDPDGRYAARGRVNGNVLELLLEHEYFALPPPKSTGREQFGGAFIDSLVGMKPLGTGKLDDLLATVTALTARAIARALDLVPEHYRPHELVVGGGGVRNRTLMQMLAEELPDVTISTHEDHGWPSDMKEAIGFALLADAAVRGVPAGLPNVTGARDAAVLGVIAPGRSPRIWPDWINEP